MFGLACVIYEEGVEKITFQHRLNKCSVFPSELLCMNLAVKEIQDSLRSDCYKDSDIHFSYAPGHSGNFGNDRDDQLA
ncbi:hypothetical protein TNCV_3855471 [Trichonephila clavipes]|nr:hypothetical protein TNCV_3855471 [Trichonephila clavipes]